MGVTIRSGISSIDMSYGGFGRLRNFIASQTNKEICQHYLSLDGSLRCTTNRERGIFFEEYDAKTAELLEQYPQYKRILKFLYAPDAEGKVGKKTVRDLYWLLRDAETDEIFGYAGWEHPATLDDFKRILLECMDEGKKMKWY